MCFICGGFKEEGVSVTEILKIAKKLKHRSKSEYGLINNYNERVIFNSFNDIKNKKFSKNRYKYVLIHGLLPIVNKVHQPLINKGIFLGNLEIYNWKELAKEFNLDVKNDSELLFNLLENIDNTSKKFEKEIETVLSKLEGVYSFCYIRNEIAYFSRDLIGEKPLFFQYQKGKGLYFSSEKKALNLKKKYFIGELDPKFIYSFNIKEKELKLFEKKFFKLTKIKNKEEYSKKDIKIIYEKTEKLLIEAIKKQIPDKNKRIGILFSGGIDSTFIAFILKKLGIQFTCYTAKVEGGNIKEANDLIYAKKIAEKYNFNLKIASVKVEDMKKDIKKVIGIIEDKDYIKVSVALPFYYSLKEAKKDGIDIIFSGIGSEEVFAGYRRHKQKEIEKINQECLNGLKLMYYRDLYRDDCLCMNFTIELRCPFLDKNLIEFGLNIPHFLKINEIESKFILRDIALKLGIDKEFAFRKKNAAQYGSKFDKGLLRLAKDSNKKKQEFLDKF
jgi:asparagine synthase (glutamine-hydrolysing)